MVTRSKAKFTEAIAPHPKTPTEFEHRIRSLSLTDALIAVEWLNTFKKTKARKRVLQIRDELEQLRAMLNSLKGHTLIRPEHITKPGQLDEFEFYTEFRERHNKLNETLARYSFCPVMAYDVVSGAWRYNAIPKKARGLEIEIKHQGLKIHVNEASVVAALARLAANGDLHKLRLCAQCRENWRVSEREIDRFCSQRCREAFYRAQPNFTDRRKKIQKDWRENEKSAQPKHWRD